jgi:hypothetical protein
LQQHTASIAAAFRAVTMLAAWFEHGGALDRILQNRTGIAEAPRRRCARMSNWLRFRQDFPASGAKAISPVRFGTAVLSELSAFATIKYRAERSGR